MSLLLSLLTGTWTRLAGIVAGIAGLAVIVFGIRKSGADSVTAKVERKNADTARRMADAEAAGDRTAGDVVDRLRRGGF